MVACKNRLCYLPDRIKHKIASEKCHKEVTLTPRQEQILNLITTRGASNKMIARSLNISESTVKLHVASLLKKYCVRNRTQLALFSKEKNKV